MNKEKKKILHLTLKKKWFDLIKKGNKKYEYREVKPYWISRIREKTKEGIQGFRDYNEIYFKNGYSPNSPFMRVELLDIIIMDGFFAKKEVEELEEDKKYFALKLGKVLEASEDE